MKRAKKYLSLLLLLAAVLFVSRTAEARVHRDVKRATVLLCGLMTAQIGIHYVFYSQAPSMATRSDAPAPALVSSNPQTVTPVLPPVHKPIFAKSKDKNPEVVDLDTRNEH